MNTTSIARKERVIQGIDSSVIRVKCEKNSLSANPACPSQFLVAETRRDCRL